MITKYAIRCPKCGLMIKLIDENTSDEELKSLTFCYGCEEEISLTSEDIVKVSIEGNVVTKL
jgi:hypothetical protein